MRAPSFADPSLPGEEEVIGAPASRGGGAWYAWRALEMLLFHAYLGLLVWSFGPFLHVPVEPARFLEVAVPVSLAAWAMARWRWLATALVVAVVLALGLSARYAPLLWWQLRSQLLLLGQLLGAAWSGHPLPTPPGVAYGLMTLGGLLAGILAHRERAASGRGVWLLGLGAAVLLVQWLWYWDPAYSILWPAMALGLAWLAAREAVAHAPRASSPAAADATRAPVAYSATPARQLTLGVLAAVALLALVAALPTAIPPASLGSLGQRFAQLMPSLERLRGAGVPVGSLPPGGFDLSSTGFAQANDRLGGPVLLDPTPVMRLRLYGAPAAGTLYLRGMADDVYTGLGWKLSPSGEPTRSRPPQPAGAIPPSAPRVRLEVEPLGSLPVVFYPLQPVQLSVPAEIRSDGLGNLYAATGALQQGYELVARLIPVGGPGYAPSSLAGPVPPPDQGNGLQLPAEVPARVRELAQRVTAGSSTPLEKARALERFLKSSYPYTLDASAPPPGRDFVDFFLFEERQGYCTYYSSAMAVMLRTLGIPARWVTGFRVDLAGGRLLPDGGRQLEVRNADAHAWVEAWIPGRGWVPFDPTPGATETASTGAGTLAPAPDAGPGGQPSRPPLRQPQSGETGGSGAAAGTAQGAPRWPWFALLGALLAAFWTGRGWWREMAPVAGGRAQMARLFRLAERLGRLYGVPRRRGETPTEYAARVGRVYPVVVPPLERLAVLYERALFAPEPPAPSEAVSAHRAWQELNRRWAELGGRWRHAWRRWLSW
ncbi:MAG: transglutaminaseTgpA domain-containing protein [Bacillota bacterium]|nr:transglutaminaseTgpA domain-containing protein [Bacillota bacterium]